MYRLILSYTHTLVLAAIVILSLCSASKSDGVINPLGHQADPQPISRIEQDGKRWYYFPSANRTEAKVYMFASNNLSSVYLGTQPDTQNGRYWERLPSTGHVIFNFTKNAHQLPEAPAMFRWNESHYVMYVSSDGPKGNRLYTLHNDGKDLTRDWTFAGVVQYTDGTPVQGYDAYAFNHPNGNKYLMYTNVTTIYINKLAPEYGFATVEKVKDGQNGTVVASRYEDPFTEAPDVFIQGKTLNLLYTQNDFFSPNYTTFNHAISTDLDPLDSATWQTGKPIQVLASNNQTGVYGTGSVGTFIGPDNKPWIAYTCFYSPEPFNRADENLYDPRQIQAQPLELKNDQIQPLIPVKPTRQAGKSGNVHRRESSDEPFVRRYTDLDLRFLH